MEESSQSPNAKNVFTNLMSSKTPPKEFFNFSRTSVPKSMQIAQNRVIYNLEKFKTFYSCIAAGFFFVFILFKPAIVLLVGILAFCAYGNIYTPKISDFTFTKTITNSISAVLLFIFVLFFNPVVISILAFLSLLSLMIITHALTIEEDEMHEDI